MGRLCRAADFTAGDRRASAQAVPEACKLTSVSQLRYLSYADGGPLHRGPLALGFEAPMFVPLHLNSNNLTRARQGEGNRPFTAGAGSSALVAGLVVVPYVLSQLRALAPLATATLDWRLPPIDPNRLL